MKKILLILVLGISTNVWSASELKFTCDLWGQTWEDMAAHEDFDQLVRPQNKDLIQNLKIHIKEKNGSIFSETFTSGSSVNLKILHVSKDNIYFQTRRPLRWSMTGSLNRNTGALEFNNHRRDGGSYKGDCEIKELN